MLTNRCCAWYRIPDGVDEWHRYFGFTNMTKETADEFFHRLVKSDIGYYEYCIRPTGIDPNTESN